MSERSGLCRWAEGSDEKARKCSDAEDVTLDGFGGLSKRVAGSIAETGRKDILRDPEACAVSRSGPFYVIPTGASASERSGEPVLRPPKEINAKRLAWNAGGRMNRSAAIPRLRSG